MVESNLKDGLNFLTIDHNFIRELFSNFRFANTQEEKVSIVKKFIREISGHASAEERYFYPLIRDKLPNGSLLYERNHLDDQMNKEMLQFLYDFSEKSTQNDFDTYMFNKTVEKFITIELEHLEQEETDVFPLIRKYLTNEELVKLEDDLRWAKQNAPLMPHPGAVAKTEFGSKILHPIAGLIDRTLDTTNTTTTVTTNTDNTGIGSTLTTANQ